MLGVHRNTVQNWERGFTRVPTVVEFACQELTRRWMQRPEFGPVALVHADEPIWPKPDYPSRSVFVQCELYANNELAIRQAVRLSENAGFHNPLIIDQVAEIIWDATAALTLTPTLPPNPYVKNLIIRPEIRYDTSLNGTTPFAAGTKESQFTFGGDVIVPFTVK